MGVTRRSKEVGMVKRRLKLVFPPEIIREPIIYHLGAQFNVITNILRANVEIDKGWAILELEGDRQELDLAVSWLIAKGIDVIQEDASLSV